MIRSAIIGALAAAGLAACQTTTAEPARDALLSNAGPDTLAEISDTVSLALSGRKTVLAKTVLTTRPDLIIDPKYVDDRSLQRPDHFRLQVTGTSCHLLHEETQQTYPLRKARCTAL